MPRSPALAVELADSDDVGSPLGYTAAVATRWPGSNSVPSRQSANRMPASFRASATTAVALPRLAAILVAHSCSAYVFGVFHLSSAHAASTSSALALLLPALLIRPRCCFSPELCSRGTKPR